MVFYRQTEYNYSTKLKKVFMVSTDENVDCQQKSIFRYR